MTTRFTTRQYVRAHGKAPRGSGMWAFQETTADTAFEAERFGPVEFFHGTLTEAKQHASYAFPGAALVAVLS